MKVTVSRGEVCSLIGRIQNIVPSRPVIPILSHVLVEVCEGRLTMTTSDATVGTRAFVEAQTEEPGSLALPAKKLFPLIRELSAPQLTLQSISADTLQIHAGSSRFSLKGVESSLFPALPELSQGVQVVIPAETLKEMLLRTSFCAATGCVASPSLEGVCVQLQNGVLSFISSDAQRVAKVHTQVEQSLPAGSHTIPLKAVSEMIHLLELQTEPVRLTLAPNKARIEGDAHLLVTQLLAGEFPDLLSVFPKKQNPLPLHREELLSLLRQVRLFTTEASSAAHFLFTPGSLQVAVANQMVGAATVQMSINYSGEKREMALNPHLLLDILQHCTDEVIDFTHVSAHTPALVTDSTTAHFLLMPMRLDATNE